MPLKNKTLVDDGTQPTTIEILILRAENLNFTHLAIG